MFRIAAAVVACVLVACRPSPVDAAEQQLPEERLEGPAPAQPPDTVSRDADGRVTLRTMRLPSPMILDGQLTEQFYDAVPPVSDFVQQEPSEGQPATEKTEAWVFFDDNHIYVAARCWESDPSKRVTSEMRRDSPNLYNNDHFAVLFDTFYDRRNAYAFYANAQGGLQDAISTNEQPNNNWNAVWEVRASSFEQGWTIEFRIPFRSMRFREGGRIWGVNFRRMVRWKNEISFLTPIPASYGRRGLMMASFAGSLVGFETPSDLRNIDIKPYVLGSVLTDRSQTPAQNNDLAGDVGVDVKWGITQQLIADFTYNTDFAQVEDDEEQVNLTRFSLFFPEKREFFLEGQDILSFGGTGGGRGGGGGGGGPGGGGFGPNNTPVLFFSRRIGLNDERVVPILGGGRLLGRAGPYNFGALSMRTADTPEGNAPATDFTVFRMSRDVLRRSRIGLLATRRAPTVGYHNYAYGADAAFNVLDNVSVDGYWAATRSTGTGAPPVNGDEASYKTRFNWNADRYGLQAEHLYVGEDFDPEVGFLRRSAFRQSYGQARFSPRPASLPGVRKVVYEASFDHITAPSGSVESKEAQGMFRMELENSDTWNVEYTRSFEQLAEAFEVAKNVSVPVGGYSFQQVKASYFFGPQRPVNGSLSVGRGSFYGGMITEISWRGRVELTSRFYVEPTVSWNRIDVAWGEADTNLVSSRLTYTLSPRMFVAALLQYQSRTDSLSTNARFRWEYLPGSELFVVYSDGRDTLRRGFPEIVNRSFVVKATRLFRW
jgi:hypothetical protein